MKPVNTTQVYLGIGSNIGDRMVFIQKAIDAIARLDGCRLIQVAPVFETKPVGYAEQGDFLNTVVMVETSLTPDELLQQTQTIEHDLHRVREIHWGPRTIDIDILFYGKCRIESDTLTIPHPLLHQRGFVLAPMYSIAKDYVHPVLGKTIAELYDELADEVGNCKMLKEWEFANENWQYSD